MDSLAANTAGEAVRSPPRELRCKRLTRYYSQLFSPKRICKCDLRVDLILLVLATQLALKLGNVASRHARDAINFHRVDRFRVRRVGLVRAEGTTPGESPPTVCSPTYLSNFFATCHIEGDLFPQRLLIAASAARRFRQITSTAVLKSLIGNKNRQLTERREEEKIGRGKAEWSRFSTCLAARPYSPSPLLSLLFSLSCRLTPG